MTTLFWIITAVLSISILSFVGLIMLSFGEKQVKQGLLYFVSFSAGSLLGDAFLHLLPYALRHENHNHLHTFGYVLAGITLFFSIEKIVLWHHCHYKNSCKHPITTLGTMNLLGDALHNFIDGTLIAGSFIVSIPLGITTSIAIALHEIPQEISDFCVLLHAEFSIIQAAVFNFTCALTAIAGALTFFFLQFSLQHVETALIPVTAGGFIYIAGSDLIPELHKKKTLRQHIEHLILFILGIGAMYLLTIIEH